MNALVRTEPEWLTALRAAGAARFAEAGLPSQRQEAWKYTGLNRLKSLTFEPAPSPSRYAGPSPVSSTGQALSLKGRGEDGVHRLVFVDGRFDPSRSAIGPLPEGVILASLAEILAGTPELVEPLLGSNADIARRPMVALNSAWIADGLVLIIPPGIAIPDPIEVIFSAGDAESPVSHPRHLISLGENAGAVILERHLGGAGGGFANAVTEITLAAGATLGHYVAHDETPLSLAVESVAIRVGRDASYRGFGLTAGGGLVRRDIEVALEQPGGSARIDGAYLVDGDRHADTTILVDHRAPHCQSRQTQKGVVGGHGRAVFQGKILVRPDAQKTDGAQLSQTLLLSPEAEIDVKPELEIHADDVKCSHGATVGRLDADALFFLRARGIPEPAARALLIEGFIGGALDEIAHPQVRETFAAIAANWLHGHSSPESAI
jgi:Fe-S cluster assembly protein SufD